VNVESVLLIARLLLAAVFAVAAASKFVDRTGARQAMLDFGLPPRAALVLGSGLPFAEFVVALALLPHSTAQWGAFAALVLLTAFLLAIGVNLLRGRRPNCHCFGKLHSEPIGASVIARNLLLAALALLVAWPAATQRLDTFRLLGLALIGLLTAAAVVYWVLLRDFARTQTAPSTTETALRGQFQGDLPTGLPAGSLAPHFELRGAQGIVTLEDLLQPGLPVALLFLYHACSDCQRLLPHIAEWQREHAHAITFAIVSRGSREQNRAKLGGAGFPPLLLQNNDEVAQRFGAWISPSLVVLKPNGRIWSRVAIGSNAVERMVNKLITRVSQTNEVTVAH
jgi:hypothetical protein